MNIYNDNLNFNTTTKANSAESFKHAKSFVKFFLVICLTLFSFNFTACKKCDDLNKISGRKYQPFEYFGSPKAKYVVVIMGSGYHTVKNYIKLSNNKDFGVLKVNLYRPFATSLFLQKLPLRFR